MQGVCGVRVLGGFRVGGVRVLGGSGRSSPPRGGVLGCVPPPIPSRPHPVGGGDVTRPRFLPIPPPHTSTPLSSPREGDETRGDPPTHA